MSIQESFFATCTEAVPATSCYLSLYCRVPYYGGPEEGGWWGSDCHLVASQHYASEEAAEAAKAAVKKLAKELTEAARRECGEHCLAQMEWLEARGLDSDFLPEVDGEEEYFVVVETSPGVCESRGSRHYE